MAQSDVDPNTKQVDQSHSTQAVDLDCSCGGPKLKHDMGIAAQILVADGSRKRCGQIETRCCEENMCSLWSDLWMAGMKLVREYLGHRCLLLTCYVEYQTDLMSVGGFA